MLVGYMRISKRDGRQTLALQRDALTAAGVAPQRLYAAEASGRRDDRPGLRACLKALQPGNTFYPENGDGRAGRSPDQGDRCRAPVRDYAHDPLYLRQWRRVGERGGTPPA